MQREGYDIDKCDKEWIVSANGNELLRCAQKKMAVEVAKKAAHLLGCQKPICEDIDADTLDNDVL